ncbi:MAG: stringent starvation protein B [Alphaproteobacteria bacterium]|jgi:stringent starvation protein B
MQDMTPNQPYLLRAFFDWIIDNGFTPYMVVDVNFPNVQVPMQFVNEGQIVLNVSPGACVNFSMDFEWVEFQARFSGQPMTVSFPCCAVGAIYAKENGAGSVFTVPEEKSAETDSQSIGNGNKKVKKTTLAAAPKPSVSKDTEGNKTPPTKPTKRPGLRVVK